MELVVDMESLLYDAILDVITTTIKEILINKFKLSNVKHTLEYTIMKHIAFNEIIEGVPTYGDDLYKKIKKKINGNNKRKTFYYFVNKLVRNKLIIKQKMDGLTVLTLDQNLKQTLLNLIKFLQNSNSDIEDFLNKMLNDNTIKPRQFKELAREFIKGKQVLSSLDKLRLWGYFEGYLELIENTILCFVRKECVDVKEDCKKVILKFKKDGTVIIKELGANGLIAVEEDRYISKRKKRKKVVVVYKSKRYVMPKKRPERDDLLFLPYKTRFNSKKKLYENVEKINKIMENAFYRFGYKDAVYLTLTTDPKKHKDIIEGAKKIGYNFNRFMSYVRKKLGFRPKYLAVLEFQQNGNVHLHIILFGVKFLMHYKKISALWKKYGQGEIIDVKGLKWDGKKWTWKKGRPKDCKEDNLSSYLSKYLIKAFYDHKELCLYWLTNKRFVNYSRGMIEVVKKIPKRIYVFFGSYKNDVLVDLDDFIEKTFIVKSFRKMRDYVKWFGDRLYYRNGIVIGKWSWLA